MPRISIVVAVVVLLVAPVVQAGVLHFEDTTVGTSAVPGALAMLGLTAQTTFTSSSATFNTLLTTGGPWDLVIYGEQGGGVYGSAQAAILSYIGSGGKVLATTWLSSPLLGDFEASRIGTNAGTITVDAHPIFAGLPASFNLSNPGWGIYSTQLGTVGGGVGAGSLGAGFAAVIGNGGQTIVQGPLFDTFANLSEGELFVANEIGFLIGTAAIPEPGTMALFGAGLATIGLYRLRRRKVKAG